LWVAASAATFRDVKTSALAPEDPSRLQFWPFVRCILRPGYLVFQGIHLAFMSIEFTLDVAEVDFRRNTEEPGTKVTFIYLLRVGRHRIDLPKFFAFLASLRDQIVSACHAREKRDRGS
jgi:hypothetical protein